MYPCQVYRHQIHGGSIISKHQEEICHRQEAFGLELLKATQAPHSLETRMRHPKSLHNVGDLLWNGLRRYLCAVRPAKVLTYVTILLVLRALRSLLSKCHQGDDLRRCLKD